MYTVKGKADKNHLLAQHQPLVKRLAHQMKAKLPPSVEVDDLIQAGMMGLLDAINRYEDNHGAQFETYAVLRIRGAMVDELRANDWMPRSTRQNMKKVESAMTALQQRLGRAPTELDVAKSLDIPLEDYQEMLFEGGGHQLVYYEDFHDDDGNDSFLDRYAVGLDSLKTFSLHWNGAGPGDAQAQDWPALWSALQAELPAIAARAGAWEAQMSRTVAG